MADTQSALSSSTSGAQPSAVAPAISGAASLAAASRPPPPVILDLDAHNFSKWNTHLRALLGQHGLCHHVDGSVTAAPNDAAWLQDDFAVITAMYGLISRDVLDIIQENDDMTARQLWQAAETLFNDNKDGRSIVLLSEFHSLVQGDMTVTAYCKEQKRLVSALRDVDTKIDDRVLVLNIIRGLSPRLSQAASIIAMAPSLPSFSKVRSQLVAEESRMENSAKAAAAQALVSRVHTGSACNGSSCRAPTPSSGSSSNNNRNKGKPKNKGRSFPSHPRGGLSGAQGSSPSLPGAGPWICYNPSTNTWAAPGLGRAGVLGPAPQQALTTTAAPLQQSTTSSSSSSWDSSALVAALNNLSVNGGWVVDSGASSHMTSDDRSQNEGRDFSLQ